MVLKNTTAGQRIIHTDHGIGGMLLTQQISPLLIRQAPILRPLSSTIMEPNDRSQPTIGRGCAQKQGLEEEQASESKLGFLELSLRHVTQI